MLTYLYPYEASTNGCSSGGGGGAGPELDGDVDFFPGLTPKLSKIVQNNEINS